MFRDHQPTISGWARARPENLARVAQFCVVSARQRFYNVPAMMEEAREARDGSALAGWKHRAYHELWDRRAELHWNLLDILDDGGTSHRFERECHALAYVAASYYGLNCAKAGFLLQLAFGVSACLDSVNVARLGLSPHFCAHMGQRTTPRARHRLAARYSATCRRLGGTARLWDDWCEAIAIRYPERFPTAEAVSAWHLTCLGLE